jgi:septal ring factor EnvC (AmiA/AmiB activator)
MNNQELIKAILQFQDKLSDLRTEVISVKDDLTALSKELKEVSNALEQELE